MFSKIIAVLMSILSFFSVPFSQISSETKLKSELAKGNYESPYIVRPLDNVTVNGISIEEYGVTSPDGLLFSNAAETLCSEIYKACGKKINSSKNASKNFIISETLDSTNAFTLKVENGNVYITGSADAGISRGITAFADEVLLNAKGSFELVDGYEYIKTFTDFVTYEDFGAIGDGKTDDFEAIIKTHEYANANGLRVFANETATY